MRKTVLLILLLAVLTGCGRRDNTAGKETLTEGGTETTAAETETDSEPETESSEAVTEGETEEQEPETLTPKPEYNAYNAQRYNHPEEGYFNDYEYNYDTDTWDLVYTNQEVRLIWHENSDNKIFIEYDGKCVELPWGSNNSYMTGTERRDMNGDGVDEFILWVDERGNYVCIPQIYDIANERDLSPLYYRKVIRENTVGVYLDYYFLRPEYAGEVAEFMNEELLRRYGDTGYIKLEEDGSLNFLDYTAEGGVKFMSVDRDGTELENGIRLHFYKLINLAVWACNIYFQFDENGCHIERMEMTFY